MAEKRDAHIYKRGDVFWTRFTVRGDEIRRSTRTSAKQLAQRRANDLRDQALAAAHFGDQRITWEAAVVEWTDWLLKEVGPRTAQRYGVSIKELTADFGAMSIEQIGKREISAFIKRRRRTVTNATIRRDLGALSSLLGYAEDQDWREDNPVLPRLKRIKEKREPIILPEPSDIETVIRRAPGNLAHMIRVAWLTGCRQEELSTMDRRRIDKGRAQATVVGKGRKMRVLPLSRDAMDAIAMAPAHITSTVLFHHDGEPYRNVSARFRQIVLSAQKSAQEAKRPFHAFRFHDLRHRYAVDYLKAGGNIYDLQAILGHSSVKTTEMYLDYLTPEEQQSAKHAPAQKPDHLSRSDVRPGRNRIA